MDLTGVDAQTAIEPQTEIDAIKQVIATVEHSQQNELVDEFVGLFRQDAIWTTAHGKRLFGRDEISAFTHRVLPGAMKDLTATYRLEHVAWIRPDVAAVKVHQRYTRRDGGPIEGQNEGSPLYVMAKEGGQWRLVACQNTQVLDS